MGFPTCLTLAAPLPPLGPAANYSFIFSVDRFVVAESALLSFPNRQRHVAPLHLSFLHLLIAICSDDGKVQASRWPCRLLGLTLFLPALWKMVRSLCANCSNPTQDRQPTDRAAPISCAFLDSASTSHTFPGAHPLLSQLPNQCCRSQRCLLLLLPLWRVFRCQSFTYAYRRAASPAAADSDGRRLTTALITIQSNGTDERWSIICIEFDYRFIASNSHIAWPSHLSCRPLIGLLC
jgi:hypothetical protein